MTLPAVESRNIRNAYIWTGGGHVAKNLLGFGISITLARLLAPQDYGLLGMVTVFVALVATLQDGGLGYAVVYFRKEQALPTCFTVTIASSLLLTLATVAAAPLVASFYREPRLTLILRVLSINLLLGGVRSVSQGLLSKDLRFREITVAESAGTLLAGVVGIAMAWWGYGVWSLVVNLLLSSAIQTVMVCKWVRPRLTWRLDISTLRRLLKWGIPVTGSAILWQFYDNSDYLVIGKLLGPIPLGQYTLAFRLATMVNQKISAVVNRVSFPALSAMQDDRNRQIRHLFLLTRSLALMNFPILGAIMVCGRDFILTFLGSKWLPAAVPLQFLCAVGAIKTIQPALANLADACGRPGLHFRSSVVNSILLPVAFVAGCKFGGLTGVGIAWCTVFPVVFLILLLPVLRLLNVSLMAYLSNLALPVFLTIICVITMYASGWGMTEGAARLAVRTTTGAIMCALCILARKETRQVVLRLFGREALAAKA